MRGELSGGVPDIDAAINDILQSDTELKLEFSAEEEQYFVSTLQSAIELQKLAAQIGFDIPKEFAMDDSTAVETYRLLTEVMAHNKNGTTPEEINEVAAALDRLVAIKYSTESFGCHNEDIKHRNNTFGDVLISETLSEEQKNKFIQLANTYLQEAIDPFVLTADFVNNYQERCQIETVNLPIIRQLRNIAQESLRDVVGERDQLEQAAKLLYINAQSNYPEYQSLFDSSQELAYLGAYIIEPQERPILNPFENLNDIEEEIGLSLVAKKAIVAKLHKFMHQAGYKTNYY